MKLKNGKTAFTGPAPVITRSDIYDELLQQLQYMAEQTDLDEIPSLPEDQLEVIVGNDRLCRVFAKAYFAAMDGLGDNDHDTRSEQTASVCAEFLRKQPTIKTWLKKNKIQ